MAKGGLKLLILFCYPLSARNIDMLHHTHVCSSRIEHRATCMINKHTIHRATSQTSMRTLKRQTQHCQARSLQYTYLINTRRNFTNHRSSVLDYLPSSAANMGKFIRFNPSCLATSCIRNWLVVRFLPFQLSFSAWEL